VKPKTEVITISEDGKSVEFIEGSSLDLPLGNGKRIRLSHIRPDKFWKKAAFIILRKMFGDTGNIAFWTRKWRGPWRATIISTGQTAVFETREEAIQFELEILNGALFDL
jgi:hypothetical protein